MSQPPFYNRSRYNNCLEQIEREVIQMGQRVLEMIELAVKVAVEDDPSLLDRVLEMEKETDRMEHDIMQRVIRTQALEGPVAHDALLLTAALGVVSELEKMGDEATKLAVRVRKLEGEFPFEMTEALQDMSQKAMGSIRASLRIFTNYDDEIAAQIIATDDAVDQAYKTSRGLLLARIKADPDKARQYLRCAEVFHALEHVSDHAVDLAKRLRTCNEHISESSIA